jgi:septation ring formation regulator EzrA
METGKVIKVSEGDRVQVRLRERIEELSTQIKKVARNVGEWDDQEVRDELEVIAEMMDRMNVPSHLVYPMPSDDVRFIL